MQLKAVVSIVREAGLPAAALLGERDVGDHLLLVVPHLETIDAGKNTRGELINITNKG